MEKNRDNLLDKAISSKRESSHVDFKEKFDPNDARDWCEIVKDIVAIANSGGGIIIFGLKNNGSPSEEDVSTILQIDPAKITDKVARYTGEQFGEFTIQEAYRKDHKIAVLRINYVSIPMIFTNPGTYDIGGGKQTTAFSKGSVYFRHGAKSEPGNTNDLRKSLERELTCIRKSWLKDIRKVIHASIGKVEPDLRSAQAIRVVDDLSAPAYRQVWDESAYQSPQEIVVGALKSWKRDKSSYASESDMWELYASRNNLQLDKEKTECLLESAINRHAPFFFFAQLLDRQCLIDFMKRVASTGRYPAPNAVVKLAYAMGGRIGSDLLVYIANNCSYPSIQARANRLKKTISKRNRIKILYGTGVRIGIKPVDIGKANKLDLEKLMAEAIKTKSKEAIKHLDAFLYGSKSEARRHK